MINQKDFLWVEKYRPKLIEECVLPPIIRKTLSSYVKNKTTPTDLLFYGSPGTGKTTTAKALCSELNAEVLYIDASTENGKSMIETSVIPYASTVSIQNPNTSKFIIMDECLEENETVRIGTIDNYKDIPLKNLEKNKEYPVVSFNMETKELENDTAYLCTDKEDELYEVELSNGQKIICNENHPFVIFDENLNFYKKRVNEGIQNCKCRFFNGDIYTINNVIKMNKIGHVMDIHVTKNHTFITSNGLITSNCDYLSSNAQASLRPVIEKYSNTTRFIFTCNYQERVIPAIKSRCAEFNFSVQKEDKPILMQQFFSRCVKILDENKISHDDKYLVQLIAKLYPDFRKILNELQSYSTAYGQIDSNIINVAIGESISSSFYPLIKDKKFSECRKLVNDLLASADDWFSAMYNNIDQYIEPQKIPMCVAILAQYQYWASHVANQKINLMACCTELMNV